MATTTTNEVSVGLLYDDGTTRTYSFKGVDTEQLDSVKSAIDSINAQVDSDFKKTFVSDSGAAVIRISTGTIKVTEEEVIYNG